MFRFRKKWGRQWLVTRFTPAQIANFHCFDAVDGGSNTIVVLTRDANLKSFQKICYHS